MKSQKRNLILLYFTLVIILMGFGVLIPLEAFLVEKFGASGQALGALLALHALCQLLFSPIWGSISDSVGRKPILMIGAIGNAAALVMFGLSTHLWMLFVARALSGTFAAATMPTALAYIGDSTSKEDRGGGMGVIGAAFGTGMVLGPGIGGWLGANSLSLPFYVTGALSLLAAVLVFFILPESLPQEKRQDSVKVDIGSRFTGMWTGLKGPLSVFFLLSWLVSFGLSNLEGIMGLYALKRFGFGPSQVGVIMVVVGISIAGVQMALTGPATKRWGERTVVKATLVGSSITFLVILLAFNFITLLISTGLFALANAMLRPSISSLVSKEAKIDQGLALGLNSSFMSLGRFTGPLLAGFLIDIHLYLPYIAGSVIMFLGFLYVMYNFNKPREAAAQVQQA
ncbi:MAG: MFS transporter [Anaerolineales bacterium]|jgi:DHA1 family multidrug resistance protein-like MFS transporter